MVARLLIHQKLITENGDIIEIRIWEVEKSSDFPDGVKYSLVFIHEGERVIGYDNERRKGHHRHYFGKEEEIEFDGIKNLIERFVREVEETERMLYGDKHGKG